MKGGKITVREGREGRLGSHCCGIRSVSGPSRGTPEARETRGAVGQHLRAMRLLAAGVPKAPEGKSAHSHPNAALPGRRGWAQASRGKAEEPGLCRPPHRRPPPHRLEAAAPSSQRQAALTAVSPHAADVAVAALPRSAGLLPLPLRPRRGGRRRCF